MRAIYLPSNVTNLITGEDFKHLSKVVRVKLGEKILILNGNGAKRLAKVKEINSKEIILDLSDEQTQERPFHLDLFCGCLKKDAQAQVIKNSVELGIKDIYFFRSEYSQNFSLKQDRIDSLIKSAIQQSNNAFAPVVNFIKFDQMIEKLNEYTDILLMHLNCDDTSASNDSSNSALVIGPEGGLSEQEVEKIKTIKSCRLVELPTPIMRAPTAVCAATGYFLKS